MPRAVLVALALGLAWQRASTQEPPSSVSAAALERVVAAGDVPGADRPDYAGFRPALTRLYSERGWRPAWTTEAGLTPQATAAIAALANAPSRGLRAVDYDAEALGAQARGIAAGRVSLPDEIARFDAGLSLSVMRFLAHLHRGRADPRALGFALPAHRTPPDIAAMTLAVSEAVDVDAALDAAEPRLVRYRMLRRALATYRDLAADSSLRPPPRPSRAVQPGDAYAGAPALADFLHAVGDLAADRLPETTDTLYVGALVDGVRSFQRRHGLEPDGVLGRATFAQLGVPLARRVEQIELALERLRWLGDMAQGRLAVVNIPAFRLYLFDFDVAGERPVVRMDVIVGVAYRRRHTPVFLDTIQSVVFRPYWNVPPGIARNEVVPRIRRDPAFADREGMEIVRAGGERVYAMTPANLARVAAGSLRIRQRPGPRNALGPVKFVFPNSYNVYLHGTPAAELFARARRDFSHGCIRVSDPTALAEFLLRGQEQWSRPAIEQAMGAERTLTARVAAPLPVVIFYTTVVSGDDGEPYFYPDLYGHDARLIEALGTPPRETLTAAVDQP